MTHATKKLINELEKLPAAEQEARAARYLEDLWQDESKQPTGLPYESFNVLADAHLPGPKDASVTYEEKLYGLDAINNE